MAAKLNRTALAQARKLIKRHMGFTISMHAFRHIGGTLILDADPTAVELVRRAVTEALA